MAHEDLSKLRIDKQSAGSRPPRRKKPLLWVVAALVIIVAVLAWRGVFTPAVEIEVATVSQAYPYQTFTLLNASGYVVAQRKAAVAAKTTGQLVWLGVEEGSRVREGEVVARLENRDVTAARDQAAANIVNAKSVLEQARAELHDANLAYNRQKELVAQGIVAQADFDAAEARYRKAQAAVAGGESAVTAAVAALRGGEVALDYTLIRAPFDAVVLTKDADVGDIVTPIGAAANAKAAVVTIADLGSLQVEADVSESNIEKIKVGQPCEIQLDAIPEARFAGAVRPGDDVGDGPLFVLERLRRRRGRGREPRLVQGDGAGGERLLDERPGDGRGGLRREVALFPRIRVVDLHHDHDLRRIGRKERRERRRVLVGCVLPVDHAPGRAGLGGQLEVGDRGAATGAAPHHALQQFAQLLGDPGRDDPAHRLGTMAVQHVAVV